MSESQRRPLEASQVKMTKFSFTPARTLGTAALQFFLSISVNALSLYGAHAKQFYHCPQGQIYRVTKKICLPKPSKISSLNGVPEAGGKLAAKKTSGAQNHVGGSASSSSASQISFLDGFPADGRKPATSEASSNPLNQVDHPEYGALPTSLEPPIASGSGGSPLLAHAYGSGFLTLAKAAPWTAAEAKPGGGVPMSKTYGNHEEIRSIQSPNTFALGPGLDELGISVQGTAGAVDLDGPVEQSEAADAPVGVEDGPVSGRSPALNRAAPDRMEPAAGTRPRPQTGAALRDDRQIARTALPAEGKVTHARVIDVSEGTALDPLRDKTYDLNTTKTVPSMKQLSLPN